MRQTIAIFLDAYRELNAKRLFWVVLAISAAVVVGLGLLGNNERGMTILGFTLEVPFLSTKVISTAGFYKFVFSNVGVQFWLSWGATILALISTAGMIPEFVSSGAIELSLCKPISRMRLFLTKYAAGLLFVTLQVLIFSIGGFLVIGLRGGQWLPSVFLAVPLVVAFYSFLYCVCALVGLVTRSAITALLMTMIFWLGLWAFNTTDQLLLTFKVDAARKVRNTERNVKSLQAAIDELTQGTGEGAKPTETPDTAAAAVTAPSGDTPPQADASPTKAPPSDAGARPRRGPIGLGRVAGTLLGIGSRQPTKSFATPEDQLKDSQRRIEAANTQLKEQRETLASLTRWHTIVFRIKTFMPKTGETTELLKRYIIDPNDREGLFKMIEDRRGEVSSEREVQEAMYSRSPWWIVGTSLGFEAVVLAIATLIFCRRDF